MYMAKQVIINNLLISYGERAGESGKTLLFLHGWRSNKEVWASVVQKLGNYEIGKLAIDLPGFGQSQIPSRSMTVGDYANIVAEFIKKLELKNVIIVGHSFGGRVGIKLASEHPELISKLVLVDSAGFPMPAGKKSLMKIAAKIVKPIFKPRAMQGLRRKIYQAIGAEDYLATPELQKTFVNITGEDLTEDMKRIQAPTLIIYGQNDKDTPPQYGELMRCLIHNSKFIILNSAGHFSFLDRPEGFAEALKNFIR
jgi:pimeloyl-ACP methyl ester carboxylesterase